MGGDVVAALHGAEQLHRAAAARAHEAQRGTTGEARRRGGGAEEAAKCSHELSRGLGFGFDSEPMVTFAVGLLTCGSQHRKSAAITDRGGRTDRAAVMRGLFALPLAIAARNPALTYAASSTPGGTLEKEHRALEKEC